ncbi:hypothetical protein HYDPIDRAFT_82429 [Hydnomerulius pinastri MD-312]|nr:hypothetical protein HYDPIDRAFT_82429 [Hydnomerulius pinastri MD-312]
MSSCEGTTPAVQDGSPQAREMAAVRIQRAWRKKLHRTSSAPLMDTETRWKDAAIHAQMMLGRRGADRGKNAPRTRWKRTAFLAARIQGSNPTYSKVSELKKAHADEKIMETQQWLELVDV